MLTTAETLRGRSMFVAGTIEEPVPRPCEGPTPAVSEEAFEPDDRQGLVLVAAVLAGCGTDDEPSSSNTRPSPSLTEPAAPARNPSPLLTRGPPLTEAEQAPLDERLRVAAWANKVAEARRLIRCGATVNAKDVTVQSAYLGHRRGPARSDPRILVPFGPGAAAGAPIAFRGAHTGTYVWHCHILEHEDNDMMQNYVIA